MVEVLAGVATILGALGGVLTIYLAYLLKRQENRAVCRFQELQDENLDLGERLGAALDDKPKKK